MMTIIPKPAGLCVLNRDASLSFYNAEGALVPHREFSSAYATHNAALLTAYNNGQIERLRLGLIAQTATASQPWGNVTFFYDEPVIRALYPVSGTGQAALTTFQKRSREKSVHRGMEILLEFRNPQFHSEPMYCPVLFHSGKAPLAADDLPPFAAGSDAVEVIDLFAAIPLGRRGAARYEELHRYIYDGLIRKEQRRDTLFETHNAVGAGTPMATGAAFTNIDKRAERGLTLPDAELERLHLTQRHERVERWLEIPHRPVTPGRLRDFVHFTAIDQQQLAALATRSFLYTATPGARLLERGMTDEWNFYLLEGDVTLMPAEGATLTVSGGTERAKTPIAFLKPRKYTVTALTKVSFLWIHDAALRALNVGGR